MNTLTKTLIATAFAGVAVYAVANPSAPEAKVNTAAINQKAIAAPALVSVKQALTLKDDTDVQLKGYIVKALGNEKYQFRDATGSITVDIDDDLWQGKAISAKTPVVIMGEVDVDLLPTKHVEIDVDQVKF
jgi:uncharacterized protein (TIGR00156 family)